MNNKEVKKTKEKIRKDRISVLGGFGNKVEQVIPDVTKYTRKTKHKKS
jgi:hypothetical protein